MNHNCIGLSSSFLELATLFGQIWRLEPLPPEKKLMWRREMEWLLSVSDQIVELKPSMQTFPDGSTLEVCSIFLSVPLRKSHEFRSPMCCSHIDFVLRIQRMV